jgi:hypothetical protein
MNMCEPWKLVIPMKKKIHLLCFLDVKCAQKFLTLANGSDIFADNVQAADFKMCVSTLFSIFNSKYVSPDA